MKSFYTNLAWFDRLLPDGLPIPSSTLLSGPGGSGKPLIGNVIVAGWLQQGGSVIIMSFLGKYHRQTRRNSEAGICWRQPDHAS